MNKNNNSSKSTVVERVKIHALSHDGRGIGDLHEKKAFISGALPGEEAECRITRKRKQLIEGDAIDIITASPERVTPPCLHFGICGGCSLQHMSMSNQIALKQHTLIEQLKSFGKVSPNHLLPPLTAATEGYRLKARLGVKYVIKKDKVLVGFREKASHYLADLTHCQILHPKVGAKLTDLANLISSLTLMQHIPQIEVAFGDSEGALVFRHLATMPSSDQEKLIAFGKTHQLHIYLQPNSPAPVEKIWPTDGTERLRYTLPNHQLEFLFHPLDFTQINLDMNRLMVDQAISLLALNVRDVVLDLFCGIGNFTLPIAKRVSHVTGIEGSTDMVARATANSVHNKLSNTAFFVGNLLHDLTEQPWAKQHYDKILLDPPRAGALEILPLIAKLNPKRIVYVSCNPATLARDAGILVHQHKFHLQSAGIMNMFPHTSHVEAMALFERTESS